ncbi:MAG: hypothetical protein LBI68_01435 [Azoarcus sp.]|jgi:hypothetical protein|nr:hypothetical protein [Azoarcus sp.]
MKNISETSSGQFSPELLKYVFACLMLFALPAHAELSLQGESPDTGSMGMLSLIWSHIDLMGLLWATAKYAFLFFILSLVTLFICRKYRFFKRQNPIWNKLTFLYYLCIPAALTLFGAIYGASSSAEQQATFIIRNDLAPPVNRFLVESLSGLSADFRETLANATPEQKPLLLRKYLEGDLSEYAKAGAGSITDLWQKLPESGRTFVVDSCVAVLTQTLSYGTGRDRNNIMQSFDAAKKGGLSGLLKWSGDLFGDYAATKAGAMIRSYRTLAMLILALVLLVPVVDTLIARVLEKKQQGAAP